MPCSLSIGGKDFDPQDFIAQTGLQKVIIKRKGELIHDELPHRGTRAYSYVGITTSKAGFEDFQQQIADTITFLETHRAQLEKAQQMEDVSFSTLDFGIKCDVNELLRKQNQTLFMPAKLLLLAGELGIDIELSQYPLGDGFDE